MRFHTARCSKKQSGRNIVIAACCEDAKSTESGHQDRLVGTRNTGMERSESKASRHEHYGARFTETKSGHFDERPDRQRKRTQQDGEPSDLGGWPRQCANGREQNERTGWRGNMRAHCVGAEGAADFVSP